MPAGELYTKSTLFRACKAYAGSCEYWIMSARYGLLHPNTIIQPYEQTLLSYSVAEREAWEFRVTNHLKMSLPYGAKIIILSGNSYVSARMREVLAGAGYVLTFPLEGLSIGKRLQWLKAHTRKVANAAL